MRCDVLDLEEEISNLQYRLSDDQMRPDSRGYFGESTSGHTSFTPEPIVNIPTVIANDDDDEFGRSSFDEYVSSTINDAINTFVEMILAPYSLQSFRETDQFKELAQE